MKISWTTITAIVGAVLGLWNFVQNFWQKRVRLRVIPKLSTIRGSGFLSSTKDPIPDGFACVEVVNLSAFPVTIAEVGFSLAGGKFDRAAVIPNPTTLLPKRLEPRESIDIRATQSLGFPKKARRAYAQTQCKHTRYGDSDVLEKHRKTVTVSPGPL